MKFKEIKPGMVIHCPKEEDARAVYKYCDIEFCLHKWDTYKDETCCHVYGTNKIQGIGYGDREYYLNQRFIITEFSDLIEPDEPQMSAVEVVEWLSHFVSYDDYSSVFERLHDEYGDECGFTDLINEYTVEEIVQKITAYKAAKKEKPVKLDWMMVCRVIQICSDNTKRCVYEEDIPKDTGDCMGSAEEILKRYISEHDGKYIAVIEDVCRVKEDK